MTSSCLYPTTFIEERLLVVEAVIAWKGKSMGNQFRIGQRPIFGKTCSDFLGKKKAQNRMPFCYAFTFLSFLTFWGAAGVSCVFFLPRFWLWLHFSHGLEVVFVMPGLGCLPHVFGAAGAFSIRVFVISCVFHHGCEEPFTFLAVSLTFGSHALSIWDVFPCYELVSLISFRMVCFSPCCEPFLLLRMGLCNSFFPV